MNKILVASHGHLASGLQSSLEILTGMGSKISVIDAYVDDHNYVIDIRKFITDLNGEFGVIFTDLIGGSVNQKAILEANGHDNVVIISGVNLPIVLSAILEVDVLDKIRLDRMIKESQIEMIGFEKKNNDNISDDDFLD